MFFVSVCYQGMPLLAVNEIMAFGGVVLFGIERSLPFLEKFELLYCFRYAATCFTIISEVTKMELVESIYFAFKIQDEKIHI